MRRRIIVWITIGLFCIGAAYGVVYMVHQTEYEGGSSLLHKAVIDGDMRRVELYSSGSNINRQDNSGNTPLHLAAKLCSVDVAETLIRNGANINMGNKDGNTPLYIALSYENFDVATTLINHGADINSHNIDGNTPLICSIKHDNPKFAELLIKLGADIYSVNSDGATPLHYAVLHNDYDTANLLLQSGTKVDAVDNESSPEYGVNSHLSGRRRRPHSSAIFSAPVSAGGQEVHAG